MPERVNELEKQLHTLNHRTSVIEKEFHGIPTRILLVENQVAQLMQLERKIDKQADSLDALKNIVLEHGYAFKRYAACISLAGAMLMFLISYGDKILKLLGRGVF